MSEEGEGVRIKYIYFSSMSEEGESVRGKIKKKKCTTYKKFIWRDVHTSNIFFNFQSRSYIHTLRRTNKNLYRTPTYITLLYVLL